MPAPRRLLVPPVALALASAALLATVSARPASADRLELTDGRLVEGHVVKDGDLYRVTSRFGESTVPVKDVKVWTVAKTVDAEWRDRLAALKPGDFAGRAALAKWLHAVDRPEAAQAMAKEVLETDPENAVAHEVLGHVRHKGAWMTPDEAKAAEGLVRRGDRWFTPEEWGILDADAKAKAEEAERGAKGRKIGASLNDAVRLALAPDPKLRQEGLARIRALAKETGSPAIDGLVPQVLAFAEANDRMAAAIARGSAETATVLAECRIQLARLKRPIQNFQTSLSSNIATAAVTIQLPELEVIKIGTTVLIPATIEK
jgi:hypothetical protein